MKKVLITLGRSLTILALLGVGFVLSFPRSFVEAFKIPSSAMEPTLIPGDHLLVNKLAYGFRFMNEGPPFLLFGAPRRGDVVVLRIADDPDTDQDESAINIIKRIVALPGEIVEVKGPQLYVNGDAIQEDYVQWRKGGIGDLAAKEVPPETYFLLGDNRDQSRDSRFWSDPFVKPEQLIGRAFLIYANPNVEERAFRWIR